LEVLGDRDAAVCLELTKQFERIHRGPLSVLVGQFAQAPKGEVSVVIAGNNPKFLHGGGEDETEDDDED
jgi:16S rRNA (cytidine1402-2'-O)-methyltransferase